MIRKKLLTALPFVIFLCVISTFTYRGLTTLPFEGDSLAYHIPIARSMITGGLLHPQFSLGYYPSIGEVILAKFIFLHIPLNLYNVCALLFVFILSYCVAKAYKISPTNAGWVALSVALLPALTRWVDTQIIDIWLLVFFLSSLLLLEKLRNVWWQYVLLGISLGCLIGIKYTGIIFAVTLMIIYMKKLRSGISLVRALYIGIPILVLGLSWYIRNVVITGNPWYPQPMFGLPYDPGWDLLKIHVIQGMVHSFAFTRDAYISEYLLWPLLGILGGIYVFWKDRKRYWQVVPLSLVLLFTVTFMSYLSFPTTYTYQMAVSSLRYSYVVFIPLILILWKIADQYGMSWYLILVTLGGIALQWIPPYHPKLILLFLLLLPICLLRKTPRVA